MGNERRVNASVAGPVILEVAALGQVNGYIDVRAERGCQRASVIVRSHDSDGEALRIVREAILEPSGNQLRIKIQGSRSVGRSHVNNANIMAGGMTVINGVSYGGGVGIHSPTVEVLAVVPEGSSLGVSGDTADVTTSGELPNIQAILQAGNVEIGRSDLAEVKLQAGDITIRDFGGTAQLSAQAGNIKVHATSGGDIDATLQAGSITVTETDAARVDGLNVNATSKAGNVRVPSRYSSTPAGGPRRRGSQSLPLTQGGARRRS
jgi:hypothetical protein